jgi:cyclophilin family peptidyl-prolyl cis-trans isomerase
VPRFAFMTLLAGSLFLTPGLTRDKKNPVVVLDTNLGKIKIELFESKAPATVKNFLDYVEAKHYDGLLFHRVIPDFMIQGGGMESGLRERKTKDPIKNESDNGLSNQRGTIAMARTSEPDSATSQFFINVKDNDFLDQAKARDQVGYCVFGKVIGGMDVVDKIRNAETATQGIHENVPIQEIVIRTARRVMEK